MATPSASPLVSAAGRGERARSFARAAAGYWHKWIARQPGVAEAYLRAVGWLARPLPDGLNKRRLVNALKDTAWPHVTLPPRSVRLARTREVRLVPHVGEFDFEALFFRELAYEREVFSVLESRLGQYDAIVEIGANVGVFTTYFAKACRDAQAIFAFEPSPKAFERLETNLALNGASGVRAFNAAVAEQSGVVSFFEPAGHLTNGSLKRDFAAAFSDTVATSTVTAVDGQYVAVLLAPYQHPLIKIDVEGAEAEVLRSLSQVIRSRRPDLVIEVLDGYEAALNELDFLLAAYRLLKITGQGLIEMRSFEADKEHRDYLLVPRQVNH